MYFTSSVGDWTGNVAWEPGPWYLQYGMAKIVRNSPADPDFMTLAYPHVYMLPNVVTGMQFSVSLFAGSFGFYTRRVLTNGSEVIDDEYAPFLTTGWRTFYKNFTAPAAWIKNQTSLKISIRPQTGYPIIAVFDTFRVWIPAGFPQHLPVMGIG